MKERQVYPLQQGPIKYVQLTSRCNGLHGPYNRPHVKSLMSAADKFKHQHLL